MQFHSNFYDDVLIDIYIIITLPFIVILGLENLSLILKLDLDTVFNTDGQTED